MIVIHGPLWFIGALLICGAHVLYLWGWRRERRAQLAWWQSYDAEAKRRHEEFMHTLALDPVPSNNTERNQAW